MKLIPQQEPPCSEDLRFDIWGGLSSFIMGGGGGGGGIPLYWKLHCFAVAIAFYSVSAVVFEQQG